MEEQTRIQLIVAGTPHYLDLVQRIATQARKIEVKPEEVAALDDSNFLTELKPADAVVKSREIVFFKREGVYMVLAGHEAVRRGLEASASVLGGRLISKPALKRCRVESEVPQETFLSRGATRSFPEEFRNIPRIIDKRTPRASVIESNRYHDSISKNDTVMKTFDPVEDEVVPQALATPNVIGADGIIIVADLKAIKPGMSARYNGKLMRRDENGLLFDCPPGKTYQPKSDSYDRAHAQIKRMAFPRPNTQRSAQEANHQYAGKDLGELVKEHYHSDPVMTAAPTQLHDELSEAMEQAGREQDAESKASTVKRPAMGRLYGKKNFKDKTSS